MILQCEISKADAPVKWFKDGEEIKPSKNAVIKADGKKRMLILKKALKSDIGQYTCDCGTDKTSGKLNIEGKEISMSLLLKLLGLFLPEANDACWLFTFLDREIKLLRPLYSVEVTETETARFETEISEDDIHANWKLKGEALLQTPVRLFLNLSAPRGAVWNRKGQAKSQSACKASKM